MKKKSKEKTAEKTEAVEPTPYSYETAICAIGNANTAEKISVHQSAELEAFAVKLEQKTEAFFVMNNNYQLQMRIATEIQYEGRPLIAYSTENINFDNFLGLVEHLESVDWSDVADTLPAKKKKK